MFKRILVPLDGSACAEQALPVAARIARATGGSLLLLQIITQPARYGTNMTSSALLAEDIVEAIRQKAKSYLAKIAVSPELDSLQVQTRVEEGPTALSILTTADTEGADLIVLCSHGYRGVKRLTLGSVAHNVAWHSSVPVLVLHEQGSRPDASYPDPQRPLRPLMAIVALDGSALAETALEPATNLVAALAAPARGAMLLTRVVPPAQSTQSAHHPPAKAWALTEAQTYLNSVAKGLDRSLQDKGIDLSITTHVATGEDVATTLLHMAENEPGSQPCGSCDLLALATHGRGGFQRLALGSVTSRVLGATTLPLLIVRAGQHVAHPTSATSGSAS